MRKDIRERMDDYVKNDIKPNFSEVARNFNADYRTVKKAYQEARKGGNKVDGRKKRKPSKLDGFTAIIDDKLELGCSAAAIWKFIQDKGFTGGYTTVKNYCRLHKQEQVQKATIRVTYSPGLSAQVDWKEDMVLYDKFGKVYKFNIFLYVLPYSKLKYITLTVDRKQDTLFKCLDEAFYHTGGVPSEIWFDNMKTVVDQSRTQFRSVVFNKRFEAFCKDAGFRPIACRPYRPQTKGSVEALARVMDRLKVYNYEFYDGADMETLVSNLCGKLNYEISQATGRTPAEMWEYEEKEHLHELPENLLNPYFEEDIVRIVSKESMVAFRKCKYSVDPQYIGKEVELEISEDETKLEIYYNGECIRTHSLSIKQFNYHEEDAFKILKSDVKKHSTDDDIRKYIEENLTQYDEV